MRPPAPETLLVTRDLQLVHVASSLLAEAQIDWRQTFTSGLTGITPATKTLLVDAEVGPAMAHLLAALFLDQVPGRSAVVVESEGAVMRAHADPRVQVVERPFTPRRLREALDDAEAFSLACRELEAVATTRTFPALAARLHEHAAA
jgi:hypothetical protein